MFLLAARGGEKIRGIHEKDKFRCSISAITPEEFLSDEIRTVYNLCQDMDEKSQRVEIEEIKRVMDDSYLKIERRIKERML